MVEPQPSKLMTWVRFPLPAPVQFELADVAQLVEHVLGKDEVTGSIPVVSSSFAGLSGLRVESVARSAC